MDYNFRVYQELMPHRVREILIISSPYDAFIMEEDGGLIEHVFSSYRGISLINPPRFTMVSHPSEAFNAVEQKHFDLIIVMSRYLNADALSIGKDLKGKTEKTPIVLLIHSPRGLPQNIKETEDEGKFDKVFIWSGNRNILWTVVKWHEDRMNVFHDTQLATVRVLIYIEDSPVYYSSILPILYEAILQQTQDIIEESLNEEHRLLKLRARPKILLANNYEEGMDLYTKFRPYALGIFSDTCFPHNGSIDDEAGLTFLKSVKSDNPDLPILLMSSEKGNQKKAQQIQAHFLDKNLASMHMEIKKFLQSHLGFGDFVFRLPSGQEMASASNLMAMEKVLQQIPDESVLYHAAGNHFSAWFMARSLIVLALKVRTARPSDFPNADAIRSYLLQNIRQTRLQQQRGIVTAFQKEEFDVESEFLRIGEGSLGGKARGLAFMLRNIQKNIEKFKKFTNVVVKVPNTLAIATDYYDQFIRENNLQDFADIQCSDDIVAARFLKANLPKTLIENLHFYLDKMNQPIAVRSSSLLEDSYIQPYAGLYKTFMLPNNHSDPDERYKELEKAIKLIYSSVFFLEAKSFSRATLHRTEEEKMAISIQQVVGNRYGHYFYPTISGTAQSHNFYPVSYMNADEGIAHMALGLGKIVVEGRHWLRFSPKYPQLLPHFSSVQDIISNSQRYFFALDMRGEPKELWIDEDANLITRNVSDAIDEGPVRLLTSTYIASENCVRDTVGTTGVPVLTFANILKYDLMPLPELLSLILNIGRDGLGCEIEIEFAVNLSMDHARPHEFYLLQIRPLTLQSEAMDISITKEDIDASFCFSSTCLGKPTDKSIQDIIFVKPETFDSLQTKAIAQEISELNAKLENQGRPYLLVGLGRWGSSDPNMGIPVNWKNISNVWGIIEASTENFRVDPSQGTHFFQNITSLGILYFTIYSDSDHLDWNWFRSQQIIEDRHFVSHIRTHQPVFCKIDGKNNHGVLKMMADGPVKP